MAEAWNMFRRLDCLCKDSPTAAHELRQFLPKQVWGPNDRKIILDRLSGLLLQPAETLNVAKYFGPLVLDLLLRSIKPIPPNKNTSDKFRNHEMLCIAMSKLIATHPDVANLSIQYFRSYPSVFASFMHEEHGEPKRKKAKKEYDKDGIKLLSLIEAAYKFLTQNTEVFRELWDWSPLLNVLKTDDIKARWIACCCLHLLLGINNVNLLSLQKKYFSEEEIKHLSVWFYSHFKQEQSQLQSLLVLRKEEEKGADDAGSIRTHTMGALLGSDYCPQVISVCGVLLPKLPTKEDSRASQFVMVPSLEKVMQTLALAVASSQPVLLQGPVGCGKTTIIEHLARVTGNIECRKFLKIQMGDQTDGKLLLGSHCCTDIPGEFVWHPGPLVQAMTEGSWLLLEDIDCAPREVISILVPVLESKTITLPGHSRPFRAVPGFQLFATQRLVSGYTTSYSEFHSHGNVWKRLWKTIEIEPMLRTELQKVLVSLWPVLEPVSERILDIYYMMCTVGHEDDEFVLSKYASASLGGRQVSTRDLMKWCARMAKKFDLKSANTAETAFQDALDCFCQSIPFLEDRVKVAEAIGAKLNISKMKAEYYTCKYKPDIVLTTDRLQVGRSRLPQRDQGLLRLEKCHLPVFAYTRQAVSLLERVAVGVENEEPVLLVGETGTGKTCVVQYLAQITGHKLTAINMNQQSDSTDLLGGYKPLELKLMLAPLREEYEEIFCATFSQKENARFLGHIMSCFSSRRWGDLFTLMLHTLKSAVAKLEKEKNDPAKEKLLKRWKKVGTKIHELKTRVKLAEHCLAFSFVEGSLVKSMQNGHWILLDEINLAEAETLECLGALLENTKESVLLLEKGDREPVVRHPEFRLFACMNPATDVGKKDLPLGIRNRFTEFFMEELNDEHDLMILVNTYLSGLSLSSDQLNNIVKLYLCLRHEAKHTFSDGNGSHPHYSLRTLCRALSYASANPCNNVMRSVYEGFCLSFLTQLNRESHIIVEQTIGRSLVGEKRLSSLLKAPLVAPSNGNFHNFEGYWIAQGPKKSNYPQDYILTPSVKKNLRDLARVVAAGKHPVLLQGETSVGKTSLIQFLASASGNVCTRINNHEHTDLQEYVGTYGADHSGKLVFKEGILVEAMRMGYWIILDELNLAPTEVLEALNRVLDDNRELFIPETQQTIKAHEHFMLFATQNPPGHYGGRKVLSRAFRNRFVELHFDEIPPPELETILHQRCKLPLSYSKKMVAVMLDLQMRRRESGVFAGKHGYITLRDLFRWGERYHLAGAQESKFYDWNQHIAEEGYMLLAGKVRKPEEAIVIQEVLQKHFKREVDPHKLFSCEKNEISPTVVDVVLRTVHASLPKEFQHLVWTADLCRLAVLVGQALKFKEPVLLVGETGCGKTTICQLFASLMNKQLYAINCHMHSESADFLGGLRPVRHHSMDTEENLKLFEWVDGPLVNAMQEGSFFLADEISLADDSVLERLNSVLEPEQTLLLAEKGSESNGKEEEELLIVAKPGFHFVGTMNPAGDFGKKELSLALRNRFTEVWCPSSKSQQDIIDIIEHNISVDLDGSPKEKGKASGFGKAMVEFLEWFRKTDLGRQYVLSVRDILAWTQFINACTTSSKTTLSPPLAYIHGACLVCLDTLGSGSTSVGNVNLIRSVREDAICYLKRQMENITGFALDSPMAGPLMLTTTHASNASSTFGVVDNDDLFGISPLFIKAGPHSKVNLQGIFSLESPTSCFNAMRLLRAMQLSKPILLEGVPGVGKTSLVMALAKAAGYRVVRINLSEQTDVSDLFGADLPVEGGAPGQFQWRDGPLLRALKTGDWILLDELNLASQSVLEGLNACLDHRGEVFVPELARTFQLQQGTTRIFGCQNPYGQGGARKGLPKSFLNRFTQVYIEPLSALDLEFIAHSMYPVIPREVISKMVIFNERLVQDIQVDRKWGHKGSPWELNLRDLFRWCEAIIQNQHPNHINPGDFVELAYSSRMRTLFDKKQVLAVYQDVFPQDKYPLCERNHAVHVTKSCFQVGSSFIMRKENIYSLSNESLLILHHQVGALEFLMKCVEMNWMTMLIGSSGCGKTSLVRLLASVVGHPLHILSVSSEMDTTELLGGFDQGYAYSFIQSPLGLFQYCSEEGVVRILLALILTI